LGGSSQTTRSNTATITVREAGTTPTEPEILTPSVVTTSTSITKTAAKVSGVKVGKNAIKPTQTTLTFSWTLPKNAKSVELLSAESLTFDVLAPKPKGAAKADKAPCIATATINLTEIYALSVGSSIPKTSGDCKFEITLKGFTTYKDNELPIIEVKVLGLKAATKYTVEMQVKYSDSKYSSVTKVTGTTAKYAAVRNDTTVTKQTVMGQVTIGWKDAPTAGTPTATSYDVGIWVGKEAVFSQTEFDEAVKLLKGAATIKNANAIWDQVGDQLAVGMSDHQKTFYGVSLKCTFAVRATATVDDTAVYSAVAKIAAAPLKYPAPAKVTQSAPGTMSFTWVAPNLKNNKLPDVSPSEATSVTYTIGLYDTKKKEFMGTVDALTLIANLSVDTLTTEALTGVVKGNTIGVQQVITFANNKTVNNKTVVSAVKALKVK
jgi:hypothetical protein